MIAAICEDNLHNSVHLIYLGISLVGRLKLGGPKSNTIESSTRKTPGGI